MCAGAGGLLGGAVAKTLPPMQELQETCVQSLGPGGGHGNPLQCYCLEIPMGRGAWWATIHRVAESDRTEMT